MGTELYTINGYPVYDRHPFTAEVRRTALRIRIKDGILLPEAVRSIVDHMAIDQCVFLRTSAPMKVRHLLSRYKARWAEQSAHVSPIASFIFGDGIYLLKTPKNLKRHPIAARRVLVHWRV